MKRALVLLLMGLLLSGCIHKSQRMNAYIGQTQANVIAQCGPPTNIIPDGAGGTILVYQKTYNLGQTRGKIRQVSPNLGPNSIIPTRYEYTAPEAITRTATDMFFVGADGLVYRVQWQ